MENVYKRVVVGMMFDVEEIKLIAQALHVAEKANVDKSLQNRIFQLSSDINDHLYSGNKDDEK